MFGTLRTHSCSLGPGARREHGRFYCGLCKTLGTEFGQALRITLSYDAVFMAILADALQDAGATPAGYRCPLVPVHHRPAVAHDSPAMRYAAAVQVLLGDQWLADRGADGRRLARLTRPLLRAPVARAQGILRDFGVDVGALDSVERRQQEIEAGHPTPEEAAKPTSSALGIVFAAVADLPGTIAAVRTDAGRGHLAALGSTIGQVIYLTDALEDVEQDRRKGNFNPCLAGDVVAPERLRNACQDLGRALKRMSALVDMGPWQRHREVIANILSDRLAGQSLRAIEAARVDGDEIPHHPAQAHAAGQLPDLPDPLPESEHGRGGQAPPLIHGSQHGENGGEGGAEARGNSCECCCEDGDCCETGDCYHSAGGGHDAGGGRDAGDSFKCGGCCRDAGGCCCEAGGWCSEAGGCCDCSCCN